MDMPSGAGSARSLGSLQEAGNSAGKIGGDTAMVKIG